MPLKIALFSLSLCMFVSCENAPSFYDAGIFAVSDTWIGCETASAAYTASRSLEDKAALLQALDETAAALRFYKEGKVYQGYSRYAAVSEETMIDQIAAAIETMKNAVGEDAPVLPPTKPIRTNILRWQEHNYAFINRIQLSYIYFIMFSTAAIILITLLLWKMNRNRIIAKRNEIRAAVFIRQSMLAQEEERARIARELHDSVIAELRQIIHYTERMTVKNISKDELRSKQILLMNLIRSITMSLMPPDFKYIRLTDALAQIGADFEKRSGIPCRITIQDGIPDALTAEKQLQCYRLVQEALSNIEKHSKASEAFLLVRLENSGEPLKLCICISDDGCGLPGRSAELTGQAVLSWLSARNLSSCLGIRSMYERTLLVDGSLLLRSEKGNGMLIKVMIPLFSNPPPPRKIRKETHGVSGCLYF